MLFKLLERVALQIANSDTTQIIIVPHPMHHLFNASNLDQLKRIKLLHCAWNIKRMWQNIWKIRRRSFCMELNDSAVLKTWLLSAYVANFSNICYLRCGFEQCVMFLLNQWLIFIFGRKTQIFYDIQLNFELQYSVVTIR